MRVSRAPDAAAPLRAWTLLWQLVVLILAEVWLYRSYAAHVAAFYWATHFLVGLTAAALWCLARLHLTGRPVRSSCCRCWASTSGRCGPTSPSASGCRTTPGRTLDETAEQALRRSRPRAVSRGSQRQLRDMAGDPRERQVDGGAVGWGEPERPHVRHRGEARHPAGDADRLESTGRATGRDQRSTSSPGPAAAVLPGPFVGEQDLGRVEDRQRSGGPLGRCRERGFLLRSAAAACCAVGTHPACRGCALPDLHPFALGEHVVSQQFVPFLGSRVSGGVRAPGSGVALGLHRRAVVCMQTRKDAGCALWSGQPAVTRSKVRRR